MNLLQFLSTLPRRNPSYGAQTRSLLGEPAVWELLSHPGDTTPDTQAASHRLSTGGTRGEETMNTKTQKEKHRRRHAD